MAAQSELTDLFEYGIDIKNRRIYFGSMSSATNEVTEINSASVELAVRALHRLASDAPGKPIEIHMNSCGGSPYDMLRLYDEIHTSPCQIRFFGGGVIMSSATWLLVGCDERYLQPNCTVMIHDGSDGFEGKHTDQLIYAGEAKRLQDKLYDIYAENSRMPREFWEDVCQRDLYMTASEAVSLGLADSVLEPKKRGNLRKKRYASLKKEPEAKEMNKLVKDLYERINKKKVPKVELNEVKKEAADPHLVVDDTKLVDVSIEPKKPEQI